MTKIPFKSDASPFSLGVPLVNGNPDKDVQEAVLTCFKKLVLPKAEELIGNSFSIEAKEKYL